MDRPIPEARPQLFKVGKKLTAASVADPSVTIIEVGEALGFLLAESCHDTMIDDKLYLENVTWVRRVGKEDLKTRSFEKIVLYRHGLGIFVVQDTTSDNYLPSPSEDPYFVIFISKEQYEELKREIEQIEIQKVLESIGTVTQGLPGFSFDGQSLLAPSHYANTHIRPVDHSLIQL